MQLGDELASSPLSCGSAETSRMIARPEEARRARHQRVELLEPLLDRRLGASTSAMKERPLKRIERGLRAAFGTGLDDSWKTRFGAERG